MCVLGHIVTDNFLCVPFFHCTRKLVLPPHCSTTQPLHKSYRNIPTSSDFTLGPLPMAFPLSIWAPYAPFLGDLFPISFPANSYLPLRT